MLPLGEVDLEKVKREVAEAREQEEEAVKEQKGRDLLAYMARKPMHVSESAWFAEKGDWVLAEGLKRRLDEVETREQELEEREIFADLQKQAAEKKKKEMEEEKEKEAVLYKEIVHFLRVRQWQAGDWSEAEKAMKKSREEANEVYRKNVEGLSFYLFTKAALMAFDHATGSLGAREMGEWDREAWMSKAFKSMGEDVLPPELYAEEEITPARPVMPAAVLAAREGRGVVGEQEDPAIMGDYDGKVAHLR